MKSLRSYSICVQEFAGLSSPFLESFSSTGTSPHSATGVCSYLHSSLYMSNYLYNSRGNRKPGQRFDQKRRVVILTRLFYALRNKGRYQRESTKVFIGSFAQPYCPNAVRNHSKCKGFAWQCISFNFLNLGSTKSLHETYLPNSHCRSIADSGL